MEVNIRLLTLCCCLSFVLSRATSPISGIKHLVSKSRIARNAVHDHHQSSPNPHFLFMRKAPPSRVTAGLHKNWVLECEAGGSPPPTIHWLKNGVRVTQGVEESSEESNAISETVTPVMGIGSTKSKLFLDCTGPQAEAAYTCVAETPYQRVSADSNVMVEDEGVYSLNSLCVSAKKSLGSPARINMWTGNILETIGNDVVLFCRATGSPTPTVTWLIDEERIIDNAVKYQIQENGDLLIRDIDWNDMGVYTCEVDNTLGRDSATTFLYPVKEEN